MNIVYNFKLSNMKKCILVLSVVLAFVGKVNAQFGLSGEFRPRTEFLHGYGDLMKMSNQMFQIQTSQRSRINFDYKSEKMKFGVQLQDVRVWGSQAQLVTNDGALTAIHQAWAEVLFNQNLSLKMGRMELNYDDQRIFGSVDWLQQGRSHDLLLFKYEKKDAFNLHIGLAENTAEPYFYNIASNYKSMQFVWFNKKFGEKYTLSILALNQGLQNDTTGAQPIRSIYNQTIGQRSVFKQNKLTLSANLYYQMGKTISAYKDDNDEIQYKKLSAYNLNLDANYKINDNYTLALGYELLSGIDQTDTTKVYNQGAYSFNPLFGTNHKFNGHMDYFYVGGRHINSTGLQDFYLQFDYKKDKFDIGLHAHQFLSASPILDAKEKLASGKIQALNSTLGTELDFYGGYKINSEVSFRAGLSFMLPTSTLSTLRGGNTDALNYWGWMMFVYKPNFIAAK